MSLDGITEFRQAGRHRGVCFTCGRERARLSDYCPQHGARRVWRPLEDTAARFAAPWLALVWVLTLGRMGAPLWRNSGTR